MKSKKEKVKVKSKPEASSTLSEDSTKVISFKPRPKPFEIPEELQPYKEVCAKAEDYFRRFFPAEHLRTLLVKQLKKKTKVGLEKAKELSKAIEQAILQQFKGELESDWAFKLQKIFDGHYPERSREFLFQGTFAHYRYAAATASGGQIPTFRNEQVDFLGKPKRLQLLEMAAGLYAVKHTEDGDSIEKTVEVERFAERNKDAIPNSSLHEKNLYNRPAYGVRDRWEHDGKRLPLHTKAATLVLKEVDLAILKLFLTDLRQSITWRDEQAFIAYVGYLTQTMVAHLMPGLMPGYFFCGPPKSGKGYLSHGLPSLIYCRIGRSTTFVRPLPASSYELEVFMNDARDALFVVFDEVQYSGPEAIKPIDAALTNSVIQARRFRHGYVALPNYFTFALTAVHAAFSAETDARLVNIELVGSNPDVIEAFHRRWSSRGPELLSALFNTIKKVSYQRKDIPVIPDRRPGFGLIAHFLNKGFDLNVQYQSEAKPSELFDRVCELYATSGKRKVGTLKGDWKRFTVSQLSDFLAERQTIISDDNLKSKLRTALPYISTEKDPAYRDCGFTSEKDGSFHIKFIKEKHHLYLYVRPVPQVKTAKAEEQK